MDNQLFPYEVIECPCGCNFYEYNSELIYRLTRARYSIGLDLKITSWCRCPDYNKQEGGVSGSSHLDGEAVDMFCTHSNDRYRKVDALMRAGFKRIILYSDCIHTDISKTKTSPYLMFRGGSKW